ncbi:MAG: carbohydrate-binding family 9-like protein [Chitinophagaceae bacterium]
MKFIIAAALSLLFNLPVCLYAQADTSSSTKDNNKKALVYEVRRLKQTMRIDANWDKAPWQTVKPLEIKNFMGVIPSFKPTVEAKIMYDDNNVYVIFRVKDRFVHSLVQEYNGNVSGDACVEFFFAPDAGLPLRYFNLEINAGGTPLLFYVTNPWTDFTKLDSNDIKKIEIAHSLPGIVDPEIKELVTWTIEYRIPFSMLQKFSNVTRPTRGTTWKANLYKTASQSTNKHWITWSPVDNPKPNFHLPQFFGTLKFR